MILAFEPRSSVDIVQAIGRGARSHDASVTSTMIVGSESKIIKYNKSPYELLISSERLNKVKDQKTAKLLQRLHNHYLHCWMLCKEDEEHFEEKDLHEIFKLKLPFYREINHTDKKDPLTKKNAADRWKGVVLTFPDAKLPKTAQEFIQK